MVTLSGMIDTLGQVGSLPKRIEDVTANISKGADTIDRMVNSIDNALQKVETFNPVSGAIKAGLSKVTGGMVSLSDMSVNVARNVEAAGKSVSQAIKPWYAASDCVRKSAQDLQNCMDVVRTSSLLVNAVVDSFTRKFDADTLASSMSQFDSGWDSWAKVVNETYEKLSPTRQKYVLETLARNNFGDNIFYLGSAIKNESAGVFSGIAGFEDGINAFSGSYRNPIEAAKKIEKGVKGIVNAAEMVANSINRMITTFQTKGKEVSAGNKILSSLGTLHDTKIISSVNRILTVGGGAASLATDASSMASAVQSGNLMKMYQAGKKSIDDIKTVVNSFKDKSAASYVSSLSQSVSKNTNSSGSNPADSGKKKENDSDNADSYVCSGATLKCTFGDKSAKLSVYPDRTVFLTGQPIANISDHTSMYNIHSFGKCRTTSYPPTGSATAANHGSLTPMPCVPGTLSDWINGKDDYIIKGNPALLKSSYCKCQWGGIITITDDGQTDTGVADLNKEPLDTFEK